MAAERTVLSERSHSEPKDDDEYDDDDDDGDNFSRSSANGHIFRPGGQKIIHWLLFKTSLQRSLSPVPKEAVVKKFNCIK